MVELKLSIPEEFFKEEIRCGYRVSAQMKKLWAVELDLLAELIRVLDEGQYTYFASDGTLLGAVRHKGFIPWDDDIDISMPRDEYERFCREAADKFEYPYFLQTEYTDRGSLRGHAQLRNSSTTMILAYEADNDCKFNQGVFVDIFPLDAIPADETMRKDFYVGVEDLKQKYKSYSNSNGIAAENPYYREFEQYAAQYWDNQELPIGQVTLVGAQLEEKGCARKLYASCKKQPFEMLMINVPVAYDEILTSVYGEWKEYVVGTGFHGQMFLDFDNPYTLYTEKEDAEAAMRLYDWYKQYKLEGDLKWKDDYLEDCVKKIWKDEEIIWQELTSLREMNEQLREINGQLRSEIRSINNYGIIKLWRKLITLKAKLTGK